MIHYLVLGAGKQGTAAVLDMVEHGDAKTVTWVESNAAQLEQGLRRVRKLTGFNGLRGQAIDANDRRALQPLFTEADVCLNALPYRFSAGMTLLSLEGRTHYVDLGGNTDIVREQFELHRVHPAADELSVLPDCGLMPGMGNHFVAYALAELGDLASASVRCGGLPQDPKPPLDYMLTFSVAGLTNEYFGEAAILRDGERVTAQTFGELEQLEIEGVGSCEAFITSGGLSTMPWTFAGRIDNLDYKTVRYPGHHAKVGAMLQLGLLGEDPVLVDGQNVVPRHLLHRLMEQHLSFPDDRDLVVLRCAAVAKDGGERITIDVLDHFDERTGFTAMERTTAFSAAAVAHLIATGGVEPGPRPAELAVDPKAYIAALRKRGIAVDIRRG